MRKLNPSIVIVIVTGAWLAAFAKGAITEKTPPESKATAANAKTSNMEQATFGLGCYSCAEAIFERLKGVKSVAVGYSGGNVKDPTDAQIGSGKTGHAEVVHIEYDPKIVSYDELLEVFWKMHDPTTPNRQGKNIGSHYRSLILYHSEEQGRLAKHYKQKLEESRVFAGPIVTEIKPFAAFYPAEKEHLDFYRL